MARYNATNTDGRRTSRGQTLQSHGHETDGGVADSGANGANASDSPIRQKRTQGSMINFNPPADDPARVATLESYGILDTPPDQDFDDLARIAATICEAPIALVSLVDRSRHWFKAKVGLDATEVPRDIAFCSHTILGSEIFQVSDARQDARFRDNPLVTGCPGIVSYAGAPISGSSGHTLGTVCAMDYVPRELPPGKADVLMRLARQAGRLIELRVKIREAAQALNAKSRFLARMSHDFRTPLNAIIGYSELLAKEANQLPEPFARDLANIAASGKQLLALVDRALQAAAQDNADVLGAELPGE